VAADLTSRLVLHQDLPPVPAPERLPAAGAFDVIGGFYLPGRRNFLPDFLPIKADSASLNLTLPRAVWRNHAVPGRACAPGNGLPCRRSRVRVPSSALRKALETGPFSFLTSSPRARTGSFWKTLGKHSEPTKWTSRYLVSHSTSLSIPASNRGARVRRRRRPRWEAAHA
jgi:hypothetical protein